MKSCRAGKITIRDGFARVDPDGQLKLVNVHIAKHFTTAAFFNHEEVSMLLDSSPLLNLVDVDLKFRLKTCVRACC